MIRKFFYLFFILFFFTSQFHGRWYVLKVDISVQVKLGCIVELTNPPPVPASYWTLMYLDWEGSASYLIFNIKKSVFSSSFFFNSYTILVDVFKKKLLCWLRYEVSLRGPVRTAVLSKLLNKICGFFFKSVFVLFTF